MITLSDEIFNRLIAMLESNAEDMKVLNDFAQAHPCPWCGKTVSIHPYTLMERENKEMLSLLREELHSQTSWGQE